MWDEWVCYRFLSMVSFCFVFLYMSSLWNTSRVLFPVYGSSTSISKDSDSG